MVDCHDNEEVRADRLTEQASTYLPRIHHQTVLKTTNSCTDASSTATQAGMAYARTHHKQRVNRRL